MHRGVIKDKTGSEGKHESRHSGHMMALATEGPDPLQWVLRLPYDCSLGEHRAEN